MAAEFVTVTWTELDIGGVGLNGSIQLLLSGPVVIGGTIYEPAARSYPVINSAGQTSPPVLANDSPGAIPPNSYYTVTVQVAGAVRRQFVCFINEANGASQTLASLEAQQAQPAADYGQYMPLTGGQFTGGVGPGQKTLTDAATVTIDAALVNDVTVTLTQNTALATPLNPKPGQKLLIQAIQGGSGGFTLSYSAGWAFLPNPGAPSPVLGTAPGTRNYLLFRYDAGLAQWVLLAFL